MRKTLLIFALGIAAACCYGSIVIEGDGRLLIGGTVPVEPVLFGEGYRFSSAYRGMLRAAPAPGMRSGESAGEWKLPDGRIGQVALHWSMDGDGNWKLDYRVDFPEPVPAAELSLRFTLPAGFGGRVLDFDSRKVKLPLKDGRATLAELRGVKRFRIPFDGGMLEIRPEDGPAVLVMDNRAFQQYDYSIRVLFPLREGCVKSARMKLAMRFRPYTAFPLDLEEAANRGFADGKAGDGRGSWNDQGPDNDLSALPAGQLKAGPFVFPLVDAARNGGNACIAVSDAPHLKLPPVDLRMPVRPGGRFLYLVHTAAWLPGDRKEAGGIEVRFADGTVEMLPVVAGRDVGNWWLASGLENAMIAWNGETRAGTPVGIYLSCFELPEKRPVSLRFRAANGAVWMIAAAALSDSRVPFRREVYEVEKRGDGCRPFVYDRSVEPGSALDFSFLLDAPAGKYGFVTVRDGHFVFEKNGAPVRFHGGNLTFETCYPDREEAGILAERLARIGYNAVRLHHFDYKLCAGNGPGVNPEALDRLEYLVHACKQRGIYITFDLYTARKGWNGLSGGAYKLAIMLLPEVREEFKMFVRNWLTHVNPYTNLRWCDDPVFNSISILNENTLSYGMRPEAKGPVAELYRKAFADWAAGNGADVSGDARNAAFQRFLAEVYRNYYDDMAAFLRELGVKVPLTDQNFIPTPNAVPLRAGYDYVDNHLYWDHPSSYALPFKIRNTSVLSERMRNPREIAPSRIFGKPFTVTEYNYCFPNALRAEGSPIFGAMAAYQDWDGLYRFTYGTANKNVYGAESGIEIFEGANDPIQTLGERIVAALFLRRDAAAAREVYPVAVPEETLPEFRENYPAAAQELMFKGRTGSILTRGGEPVGPLPAGTRQLLSLDAPGRGGDATPGNAEWRADFRRQTFSVATPRSEALVVPSEETAGGKRLSVEQLDRACTISAIALDGKALLEAERILLLHLTDVQVEGSEYLENSNGSRLYRKIPPVGTLLARRGQADVLLRLPEARWRLYALNLSGRRMYELPFSQTEGVLKFHADTFGRGTEVVFAYELIREP